MNPLFGWTELVFLFCSFGLYQVINQPTNDCTTLMIVFASVCLVYSYSCLLVVVLLELVVVVFSVLHGIQQLRYT